MTAPTGSIFVLDANVFIQAKKKYYAFDLCPGFWDALIKKYNDGCWFSIEKVKNELLYDKDSPTNDEIAKWIINQIPVECWHDCESEKVAESYSKMITWVNDNPQFNQAAKSEFATVADGWLVAYAHAFGYTVVTEELYNEFIKRRVPIPNVCKQFSVPYMGTFDMLRAMGCKFIHP